MRMVGERVPRTRICYEIWIPPTLTFPDENGWCPEHLLFLWKWLMGKETHFLAMSVGLVPDGWGLTKYQWRLLACPCATLMVIRETVGLINYWRLIKLWAKIEINESAIFSMFLFAICTRWTSVYRKLVAMSEVMMSGEVSFWLLIQDLWHH